MQVNGVNDYNNPNKGIKNFKNKNKNMKRVFVLLFLVTLISIGVYLIFNDDKNTATSERNMQNSFTSQVASNTDSIGVSQNTSVSLKSEFDYSDITKTYTGTYIAGSGMRGFDLEITSCDENQVQAVFSFYATEYGINSPFGSYEMEGSIVEVIDNNEVIISLLGTNWIVQPGGYYMIDFDITLNIEESTINSNDYELYGLEESLQIMRGYNYQTMLKTYTGTYVAGQGVTCLDLNILSCNEYGQVEAEFYFYPHEHNQDVATGKYKMNGKVRSILPDGSVEIVLQGIEWIENPGGYQMMDFIINIDTEHKNAVSDSYQINLCSIY